MQRFQKISKKVSDKLGTASKSLVATGTILLLAVESQAAITYDSATGFAGTLDTTAYNTAVPIVVTVVALVVATTIGIKVLKSGKSA